MMPQTLNKEVERKVLILVTRTGQEINTWWWWEPQKHKQPFIYFDWWGRVVLTNIGIPCMYLLNLLPWMEMKSE